MTEGARRSLCLILDIIGHIDPYYLVFLKVFLEENIARSRKAALRNLIGCQGVKLFLLKYVPITTVTTATVPTITITTVTI